MASDVESYRGKRLKLGLHPFWGSAEYGDRNKYPINTRYPAGNRGVQHAGFYSPGVACPAGWTPVLILLNSNSYIEGWSSYTPTGSDGLTITTLFWAMVPEETGIICCPKQYSLDHNFWCADTVPSGPMTVQPLGQGNTIVNGVTNLTPIIAGVATGCTAGVPLVVVAALLVIRRWRRQKRDPDANTTEGPAPDGKPELDGLSATRATASHYDAELSEGETGPRSLGGQMYELPVNTTSFAHRKME